MFGIVCRVADVQEKDGFRLDQEEGATTAGGGKETEESSWSSNPQVQAQHRRSKSASDRNLDVLRGKVSRPVKKEQNEVHLKVYTASNVKEELEAAKRDFLQANVVVKKSKKVFLPRVLERFAKEASINSDDLLNWVLENVDKKLHNSIQKCMDGKSKKKPSHCIDWLPYSSRFRYIFSKDLTEKPWWV
ncbi:hypothetical protein E1A91_A12G233300v1 [Gossypium mustelinum]|uniref:DUF547 domain-containing protein n=1 Tax=Gossypium mustelinum TaxID=34275 RepID=A0A5D2WXH3_GOSMU|nr:hypothetical protein E1A91_A12G233300v1 [Gossypium mustelinum]